MAIYDITRPMRASLAVWPGDTAFDFHLTATLAAGDSVNLGSVTMSVHTGTHADAPFHFQEDGAGIDRLPLEVFVGPAAVVDVRGTEAIGPQDLASVDFSRTPRLLVRTDAWRDDTRFPETFPMIEPELPAYLKSQGVVLLGVDVPSVDPIESMALERHHALGDCGICILESLDLTGVPEGEYELIAPPLRLAGADGSPVRAVLRDSRDSRPS